MESNEFSEQVVVSEVNPPLGAGAWTALLLCAALSFFDGWKAHSTQMAVGLRAEVVAGVLCAVETGTGVDCDWQMATKAREQ